MKQGILIGSLTLVTLSAPAAAGIIGLGPNPALADQLEGDFADQLEIQHFVDIDEALSFDWLPDGRMIATSKPGDIHLVDASGQRSDAGHFDVDDNDEKGLL